MQATLAENASARTPAMESIAPMVLSDKAAHRSAIGVLAAKIATTRATVWLEAFVPYM